MVKVNKVLLTILVFFVPLLPLKAMPEDELVGKIDDEFMVTPMGQANYEIPIPALPGTGGITPKLSVSYSSSTKSALLGYGFDLKGLSIVSRVPRNKFNDGTAGCVDFTANDRFALDGARLIQTSSSNSIQEFSTENNCYAKIISYGIYENPDSFVVKTKDGLKYLYLPNTKILDPNTTKKALYWMLTSVQDTNGNYYTVSYSGDNQYHEIYPSRIDYTGNVSASLRPYASIRFNYESTPDSAHTYISGEVVRHSKCIQRISLFSGETLMRKYNFSYSLVNHKKLLTQVVESAGDGTALKPTSIQWSNAENLSFTQACYNHTSLVHKAKLTVGDYNGDGKADFVATPEDNNAGWSGWRLFLSTGTNFYNQATGSVATGEVLEVVSGDFTGDGLDDIVVLKKNNNEYITTLLRSTGSGFQTEEAVCSSYFKYSIRTVETNGDGVADLFVYFDNSTQYKTYNSGLLGNTLYPLYFLSTGNGPITWDEVELGDFNGDGLTDVYNSNNNGAYVIYCDGLGGFSNSQYVNPSKKYQKHFGDFNSDGKTDILETSYDNLPWSYWWMFVSTGTGIYSADYYDNMEDVRGKQLFVIDINGDGFDDCVSIDKTNASNNMVSPTIWLNDGTGHHFSPLSGGVNVYPVDRWNIYFGDFNGDGKGDMLCTANWIGNTNWNGFQLYLMPDTPHLLLSKITDGMGNSTEITYKYMSDAIVHTKGTTNNYPLTSFTSSWPVVYQVKTPNGIGGTNTLTYKYENALVHRKGRGILGFEKVNVTDETNNSTTTTEYAVDPYRFVAGPVHSQTKIGNHLISETETEYLCLGTSVFSYHPYSTTQKTYEYTSGNLLSETTTRYFYDSYGNIIQMVSTLGDITTTTINSFTNDTNNWILGRLTSSIVTKATPSGSETRRAQFTYHPQTGLLMSETSEPSNNNLGFTKTYQRDVFGNITKSTTTPNSSIDSRTDSTGYDVKGRYITSYTNSLNHTTLNTIGEDLGLLMESEDANHVKTFYSYDSFGRQTQASIRLSQNMSPVSETTTVTGWSTGHADAPSYALYYVETQTTGSPYKIEFFDCLGRSLRVVTENAFGDKIYADAVYNNKGQVVKTSAPYFPGSTIQWTQYEYDAAGRTYRQTTPAGAVTTTSYNGYVTTITDALGHNAIRIIDQYGNLVQSTDHEGGTILYEYDLNGHCTLVTGPRTTVRMEYDLRGNRILLDDPDLGQVSSTYNAYGELTSQTDSKGTTSYQYDRLGRIYSEQRPDVTVTSVYDTNYVGLLTSTSTSDGNSRSYQYDAYGRTTQQTDVIGNMTFTTQTTYNTLNKVDVLTYPSGLQVKHNYSNNGILTGVKNASTNAGYWQLTQQDARGNVTKETFGNGLVTTNTYNTATGYLTGISTPGIQDWTYQYNLVGNLTQRRDNAKNLTETFGYDTLDRLVWVKKNDQTTQEISYDAAGNILSKTGVGTNFIYQNGTNRLMSYDSDGYHPQDWDSICYTSFHKIRYVGQGNKTLTLTYGPDQTRVKAVQTDGQTTTRKYYVGQLYEVIYKTYESTRHLCYIFAAGKPVAIHETLGNVSTVRYLHHDHLGSIQAISDEQGNLVQELSYDAWGRRRNPNTWLTYTTTPVVNAWQERGFGGHEHIDIFEMVNMDGRMYDPVLGRFLSPDPFVQAPDFTQGLNRYIYCLNNPLSLIDPSGYSWLSNNWKPIVASVVGIAVSVVTAGSGSSLGVAILAGAAGGAASALTGALLNGANTGQVAKATFTGAFWGAVSALLTYGSADEELLAQLFKHTISQGWLEGVQGGNMFHGFLMGAVSSAGGYYINKYADSLGKVGEISANAVLSGTVDELGGGKFANGAITGAFSIMFNDMMHNAFTDKQLKAMYEKYQEYANLSPSDVYKTIGGPLGEWAIEAGFQDACAARMSYALNYGGFEIKKNTKGAFLGGDGKFYIVNAKKMADYLTSIWGKPRNIGNKIGKVKNAVFFQKGPDFTPRVSGHVDIIYRRKAAKNNYEDCINNINYIWH